MEEGSDCRKWDELLPDALGLIFKNLSLRELLTVVPGVCKSWRRAVMGPYCWQEIDIDEWSRDNYDKPETVDRMLRLLITRSCGSVRKLTVSCLTSDQSISYIANHAQSLRTLELPRSEINDSIMEKAVMKLSTITSLDVSYCNNIGARALEVVGKQCKSLTTLRRAMHPIEVVEKLSQNDEALAIANTMPRLKHLEIAYLLVDTQTVVKILESCENLELLDVRGCWNVNLDEKFLTKFPKLKVVGPVVSDCYDDYSEYSSSSSYLPWDFVTGDFVEDVSDDEFSEDGQSIEDFEMWFYDDAGIEDAGYDWPQSP